MADAEIPRLHPGTARPAPRARNDSSAWVSSGDAEGFN
jgi:hypothetical protein